jgi:uncharacterized membrane protein (DUF373 family)
MKQILRSRVAKASSYLEIYLSVLIMFGIVVVSINLIKEIYLIYKAVFIHNAVIEYQIFLSDALLLIIGIEFVKMLAKHTLGSAIEVLLFAIARKLIIEQTNSSLDLLWGVIAIAILFAIKKYLFTYSFTDTKEGFVVGGATSIEQANAIANVNISEDMGNTIGGIVSKILKEQGKNAAPGRTVKVGDALLRITNVRDGLIDKVEILKNDGGNIINNILNR